MTNDTHLMEQKRILETRLEDGDRRIRAAEQQGKDVTAWEDFWISLLAEYESICDQLLEGAHAVS